MGGVSELSVQLIKIMIYIYTYVCVCVCVCVWRSAFYEDKQVRFAGSF